MSDMISTPSQTPSTISNDAFGALVDLLATDGIDGNTTRPNANLSLRDSSGKLDFDKIRLMYASQNGSKLRFGRVQSPTVSDDEDSDDEPSSASSVASSRSKSPEPVEHAVSGHRRSSTFGNQPWAAIHGSVAEAKRDAPPGLFVHPLSFDELNEALSGAQEELKHLRRQYDELQALVSRRWGSSNPVTTHQNKSSGHETRDTVPQASPSGVVPLDVPIEIANLSESEAKKALSALAHALNLSPGAIDSAVNASSPSSSASSQQVRRYDVASIVHAVEFLGTVDELVWRRTLTPSGPQKLPSVYSKQNVVALLARLELWERAVRRSSRI